MPGRSLRPARWLFRSIVQVADDVAAYRLEPGVR